MAELCHIARAHPRPPRRSGHPLAHSEAGSLARHHAALRDGVPASPRCLQAPKIGPSVADRSQP
jgi:hypothetical protein